MGASLRKERLLLPIIAHKQERCPPEEHTPYNKNDRALIIAVFL